MTTPAAWFPARPAILPATGGAAAWSLDDLALPFDEDADATVAAPSAEELRLAEEARLAAERTAELERVRAEAFAAGRAAGEAAGRASEAARLRTVVQAAEAALDALRDGERRWTGNAEENVCALAVAVARHVIGRELAGDAATLTELVRRALAEFPLDQPLVIRLAPADLATMATSAAAGTTGGTAGVAPNRETRWVADPTVVAGGCIVEGRERIIDGRVDTGLERLYRRLSGTNA